MGNRANVVFVSGETVSPCVYLHWNGGPESVYRFLEELDAREVRPDGEYEAARFVEIVGEFMSFSPEEPSDGSYGLSLGIVNGPTAISATALDRVPTDTSDNGFYVVDRTQEHWKVRRFVSGPLAAGGYGLRELTREECIAERDEALANVAYAEIAAWFASFRARAFATVVI